MKLLIVRVFISTILFFPFFIFAEQLLDDPSFKNGFIVPALSSEDNQETRYIQFNEEDPVWILAQWGSQKNILSGIKLADLERNYYEVKDAQGNLLKSLAAGYSDSIDEDLYLEVNGLAEFSGRKDQRLYRKRGEWWPNFLLTQKLHSDTFHRYEKIIFSMEARLEKDQRNLQQGYQEPIHAGRFVIAITVKDVFGANYLWLMLPIYDDRYQFSPFGCQKCVDGNCKNIDHFETGIEWRCPIDTEHVDLPDGKKGTQKMLFRVGSREMTSEPMTVGQWRNFEIDILPYIKEALHAANQAPELSRFSKYFNYYFIGSVTLGWEISGLNHAAMSVKNLSLEAEKKPRMWDEIKSWF